MKASIVALLFPVLAFAAAPSSSSRIKTVLFEKLGAHQANAEGMYSVVGESLKIGAHRVELNPVVETDRTLQGKSIVAMRIEVSVDQKPRPEATYGAIGIGDSQSDAIATGLGEWYMGFGLPLFQALGKTAPSLTLQGYDVFLGALGIRGGPSPDGFDGGEAMQRKILAAVLPLVPKNAEFITLDLKISVSATSAHMGEARLNGVVSNQLLAALVKLDWPRASESYIFKQAFILKQAKK